MLQLAVIFDMDGVLVDSYHAHYESWRLLYEELGTTYTDAAFAADFGRTTREILRRTIQGELSDARVGELDARKEALYRDIIRANFPAMAGAVELVQALAKDGFRLAIGSSGPPENVALVLEKLAGDRWLHVAVTGADVTRGKPDPEVFQIAAERLGVPPENCAVVEDAVHGIEAAHRAGMTAIAVTGTATRAQLAAAELVVDGLRELTPQSIRELIVSHRS